MYRNSLEILNRIQSLYNGNKIHNYYTVKKQKNVAHGQEWTITRNSEMTQIIELADKDFKEAIANIFK